MSKEIPETVGGRRVAWLIAILVAFAIFAVLSQLKGSAVAAMSTDDAFVASQGQPIQQQAISQESVLPQPGISDAFMVSSVPAGNSTLDLHLASSYDASVMNMEAGDVSHAQVLDATVSGSRESTQSGIVVRDVHTLLIEANHGQTVESTLYDGEEFDLSTFSSVAANDEVILNSSSSNVLPDTADHRVIAVTWTSSILVFWIASLLLAISTFIGLVSILKGQGWISKRFGAPTLLAVSIITVGIRLVSSLLRSNGRISKRFGAPTLAGLAG